MKKHIKFGGFLTLCAVALSVFAIPGDGIFPDANRKPATESPEYRLRTEAWKDWVLAEDYVAELQAAHDSAFMQAFDQIENLSEADLNHILDQAASEVQADAPQLATEIRKVSRSASLKGSLRTKLNRAWKKSKRALGWVGINLAYFTTATTSVVSFPVAYFLKFVWGLVKGERLLESDIRSEGVLGSRVFEGVILHSSGNTATFVVLSSILLDSVFASPLVAMQVVNSVALIAACGSALEGNVDALKHCERLREIYRFFSKITDSSAIAGTKVHQWFEARAGIVLRKKRVVSKRLCNKSEHGKRVARRVILRHQQDILEIDGVKTVEVGTSALHPIDRNCPSIVVTTEPGTDLLPIQTKFSPALDGVFVDVK